MECDPPADLPELDGSEVDLLTDLMCSYVEEFETIDDSQDGDGRLIPVAQFEADNEQRPHELRRTADSVLAPIPLLAMLRGGATRDPWRPSKEDRMIACVGIEPVRVSQTDYVRV